MPLPAIAVGVAVGAGVALVGAAGVGFVVKNEVASRKIPKQVRGFKKFKLLAESAFGVVYVWKKKNNEFACKEVPLGCLKPVRENTEQESSKVEVLTNEIEILQELEHENIVQFVACYRDDTKLYMFMELMELSVSQLVKNDTIEERDVKLYARGISNGLAYLLDKNVVHCDIKGLNVLLKVGKVAKLGDFGLAKFYEENQSALSTKHFAGTVHYMAPEQMGGAKHGKASDVWSVGCTIFEMLCRELPFAELPMPVLIAKTSNMEQRNAVKNSDDLSQSQKDFLLEIFVEKEERLDAKSLRNHMWLRE